ncbi:MAG: cobalamin-dependent protein [Xanthobacteraceae bacterium]
MGTADSRQDDAGPRPDRGPVGPRRLARSRPDPWISQLARTIEADIVPRLVLSHRGTSARRAVPTFHGGLTSPDGVAEFAEALLARNVAGAEAYVAEVRARGTTLETLYLDLLAPAARRLGDLWTVDLCDFTDVTLGLWRLQHMLHELGPAFLSETGRYDHGRQVLLTPLPGEHHTFGLSMVADFFRRGGWNVWSLTLAAIDDLVAVVRSEWFAVVGFSLGSETRLEQLASGIRLVRRASRNPALGIMVGGPVFIDHPELVARVGADVMAVDARQAPLQACNLVASMTGK